MVAWKEFLPPHMDFTSLRRDLVCGFYVFPQCEAHSISADPKRKEGCHCLNHQILIYIMLHDLLCAIRYVWSHAFTSMQIYCEGTLCPMFLIGGAGR